MCSHVYTCTVTLLPGVHTPVALEVSPSIPVFCTLQQAGSLNFCCTTLCLYAQWASFIWAHCCTSVVCMPSDIALCIVPTTKELLKNLPFLLCSLAGGFHDQKMQLRRNVHKMSQGAGPRFTSEALVTMHAAATPRLQHVLFQSRWQNTLLVRGAASVGSWCQHRHCQQGEWSFILKKNKLGFQFPVICFWRLEVLLNMLS